MRLANESGIIAPWYLDRWARRPYVIADGFIRPVPGAQADVYDLLDENYREREAQGRRGLVEELLQLDAGSEPAVTDFTSRWGLLGLFSQQIRRQEYAFTREGWVSPVTAAGPVEIVSENFEFSNRQPFSGTSGAMKTAVVSFAPFDLFGGSEAPVQVPLNDYYRDYFPQLWQPLTGSEYPEYPWLHSLELWDYLCEPLAQFRRAVEIFQERGRYYADRNSPALFASYLELVDVRLNAHPGEAGARELVTTWPSLFVAAFWLLTLDLVRHHPPTFCANEACTHGGFPKMFISTRPDRRYCSLACQNAERQRRYRRRKKKAGGTDTAPTNKEGS